MVQTYSKQRSTKRFPLRVPVTVKFTDTGIEKPADTQNISYRGVFFYVDSSVSEGSAMEFTLTLPPEITLADPIRVRCNGKVIRIEPQTPDGKIGIAGLIERFEFLAEPETD